MEISGRYTRQKGYRDEDHCDEGYQEAADLLNEGISSYYANDDGFMETVNVISKMIETRCYKRDDEAYFANIRRELLRSLSAPSRYPLTVSRATACLNYYGIDLADE